MQAGLTPDWIFTVDAGLLFGETPHQLQLLHWFPLLVYGDKLRGNTRSKY